MSIVAPPDGASSSLEPVLRRAGAVFSARDGYPAAVHFGSAAGELSVCVRSVGLVDRSRLTKLVIEAPAAQLRHLTARFAGGTLSPGGALHAAGAWWCGAGPSQIVVLAEPQLGLRLQHRLRAQALHHVEVEDRSSEWAAIGLLGSAAGKLLAHLGAYGPARDPRSVPPFSAGQIDDIAVTWLLESDRSALALVPAVSAPRAWRAMERAGRPFGISCVGLEAAARYLLLERAGSLAPSR